MLIKKIKKSMSQIQSNNNNEKLTIIKNDLYRLKSEIDKLNIRVSQYVDMNNILQDYLKNNDEIIFRESKYINKQIDIILSNIKNNELNNYGFIKNIELTIDRYYDNLKDNWRQAYRKDTHGTISILLMLEKLYDDSTQILQVRSKVKNLETRWPFLEDDLESMQDGIKEANAMIKQLKVSSNIQGFLEKASKGQASIVDLDDEILLWLKDNRFENKVKLSFI